MISLPLRPTATTYKEKRRLFRKPLGHPTNQALSRTSTAPELPVGSEAAKTTAGVVGQGDSAKHPLRDEIGRMPGGAGRGANGGRPSTAPVGLHGYLSEAK